jgi:hypothetical protein
VCVCDREREIEREKEIYKSCNLNYSQLILYERMCV